MNKDDLISRSEFFFIYSNGHWYGRSCNMQSQHMQFIYTMTSEGVNRPTNDKTHMNANANTNEIKKTNGQTNKINHENRLFICR